MDLIDQVIGHAKSNAEAAQGRDRNTWAAHERYCIRVKAEIERLRANQERMWCKACGTVTRDRQCDCTKFSDQDTQSLVNYADAMQEAAHEEAQENERLRAALDRSMIAIDDWLNTYAPDLCDEARLAETETRIAEMGTLAYIAEVQQQNRAALEQDRT